MPKEITLKKGDTLSGVADAWNTSVEELADINNIKDVNKINTGDVLKLPESDSFEWKTPEWLKRVFTSDSLGSALWESLAPEIKDKEGKTLAAKMGVPLNVRQILDPEQDRTEKDFSERTLNALGTVVERSQTEERIRDKIARGVNPNLIEYFDYETVEGRPGADRRGQYDDVGGAPMGWSDLAGKLSDPYYELKTLLGQATVKTGEDGRPVVTDVYDFEPKTRATGLDKFAEYVSTIPGKGLDPYQQVRNYMGFYGPQEGTGQGGALNIALSNGGRTMNLQQQVQNVAAQGRYGDSMLMHVNPAEVRGLAQVAPITTNPQTGQPEAFLPLLAPLLGSLLGPSVFGALGMGGLAGGALTGTLGSALGSGLAQWAATGDVKKGLLAGLTGYGIGSALQGAGAAATGAETAATQAAELSTQASQGVTDILASQPGMSVSLPNIGKAGAYGLTDAGQTALNTSMAAAQPGIDLAAQKAGAEAASAYLSPAAGVAHQSPIGALKDAFSGGINPGLQNLATGISQPSALAGMAGGMAPTAIMESQELFAEEMERRKRDEEESRMQNFLMNPEATLYAGGGLTKDKSVEMDAALLSQGMTFNNGGRTGYFSGGAFGVEVPDYTNPEEMYGNVNTYSGDHQRFTPARRAYDVNPNFMAGFQPETMYFQPNTINQPASATTMGPSQRLTDPYEGSKGGYGGPGLMIAPQQKIDPYAAYTGLAPQGLIQGGAAEAVSPTLGSPEGTPVETPYVPPEVIEPVGSVAGNRILDDQGWLIGTTEPEAEGVPVLDSIASAPVVTEEVASPIVSEVAQEPISPIGSPSSGSSSIGMSPGFGDVGGFAPPGMGANAGPPGMGGNAALGGSLVDPALVASSTMGGGQPTIGTVGGSTYGELPLGAASPRIDPIIATPPTQEKLYGGFDLDGNPIETTPRGPVMGKVLTPLEEKALLRPDRDTITLDDPGPAAPSTRDGGGFFSKLNKRPSISGAEAEALLAQQPDTGAIKEGLAPIAPPSIPSGGPSDSRGGMLSRLADQLNAGPVETPYIPPEVYDENMGGVPLPPPRPLSLPSLDMPSLDVQMPTIGTMGADLPPAAALAPLPGTILAPSNRALSPNTFDREFIQENVPKATPADRPEMEPEPEPTPKRKKVKVKRPTKKQLAARRAFLRRGGSFLAEGGDTGDVVEAAAEAPQSAESIMQDPITQEAVLFIMGESDNQQSVNNFIAKYGNEMFLQLRNSVLQSLVPGAQTEGLIAGDGQSGMADDIPGMIGADEKIAVSQDEFIVPADVVSALGDGSSDAGSNRLYEMMDRVRQAKTGGVTQPAPINVNKVMPG